MEIISQLAEQRIVERMILGYTHRRTLTYDLQDLAQMTYMALMRKPAKDIQRMHETKELTNYIGGIIRKQYSSASSEFYYTIIRPSQTTELTENTHED